MQSASLAEQLTADLCTVEIASDGWTIEDEDGPIVGRDGVAYLCAVNHSEQAIIISSLVTFYLRAHVAMIATNHIWSTRGAQASDVRYLVPIPN